ncbi:multicopper oxidase [Xylariaceae sp. FL1272]|nr:multicopper oxidase [Xylariaceae sp. FL1272]
MNCLNKLDRLAGALTSSSQNGKSVWGTLLAPTLPLWIISSGKSGMQIPWGSKTARSSNPYTTAPMTGISRHYDFNISRGLIAPDGYEKSAILVNGQFPGPLIQANWGDYIEVHVHNNILDEPQEGTAMHWHGFLQTNNSWEDGTPGVSQCPIAPGKTFTYKFHAELYGTSWYHSHYSAQYSGGMYGPIVVYGPRNMKYDVDIGPIMVNDWYHEDYYKTVQEAMSPNANGRPLSDNNLINGKMSFDCSTVDVGDTTKCTNNAGLSKFKFQTGKTHRLRFINSGSEGVQRISIDQHNMTVIANDFVEIEPYDTKVVTIGVGQRVDVVVKANGNSEGAYWLRANMTSCSTTKQPNALAAIYYDEADTSTIPQSTPWNVPDPNTCANDDLAITSPYYPMELPEPSWTLNMDIGVYRNASGNLLWTFGGVSSRVDYNAPTLLRIKNNDFNFDPDMNVMNFGSNTSVRFIVNNPTPGPMRRDVQMVRAFGHVVVQIDVTNPGVWPFHCHIAWHASAGFFSQMVFLPEKIKQYTIPGSVGQACKDWDAFTKSTVVDQIDSGL